MSSKFENHMHNKAVEKLSGLVLGLLKSCMVNNKNFDWSSISTPAKSIGKELSKHKSLYIREADIYSILSELLFSYIREHSGIPEGAAGSLQELVGEARLLELATAITKYLSTIPHPITAELTLASVTAAKESSRAISSTVQAGYKKSPYLSNSSSTLAQLAAAITKKNLFFSITTDGAANWDPDSATNRSLISSLKILLHHAIDQNRIKINNTKKSLSVLFPGIHQINKISITTSENAIWPRSNHIELPLEVCVLLGKIATLEESDSDAANLLKCLEAPAKLIEAKNEDCIRIKAAIEWSFDSLTAENETMAFLKACIGLEALLGDNEAGPSLTEALSDRCAYLIATSIRDRKNIKEMFKDLYKTRSKIVHGAINHLGRENAIQLKFAQHFLKSAIRKEMQYLTPQPK